MVGNLLVRCAGAALVLILLPWSSWLVASEPDPARLTVQVHLLFNVALAILSLPLVGPVARLTRHAMPSGPSTPSSSPRHLDELALADPPTAVARAVRETLRIGDLVEGMLETALEALRTDDEELCRDLLRRDDEVDAAQEAVKLYLSDLDGSAMDPATRRLSEEVLDYAVNLEHIGDIVEGSLAQLTIRKIERQLRYSPEGMAEIEDLFRDTIEHLRLAQRVFISRDTRMAARLTEGKVMVRRKERASVERHMARLHERRSETLRTSPLHIDVLRDLRRINAHLISVAGPILEDAGMLRESRLRKSSS